MQLKTAFMAILAAGSAMAHMNMKDPAPLGYKNNPHTQEQNKDYSLTSPITAAQYPCKGYLKFVGTPDGTPVATFFPGQSTTMSVEGGASHNGGSCQLSLSYDKTNFTVIKSFIGGCPTSSGGTFGFAIPSDAPEADDVVLAWTWLNKTGNREYYMSCAIVNINGGGVKRAIPAKKKRTVAFADRPQVFKANLGGEYCTKEGVDTIYPEPGPDVETNASNPGPAIICATGENAPTGNTGSDPGSGSNSSTSSGSSSGPSTIASTIASSSATSSASSNSSSSSVPPRKPAVSSSAAISPTAGVYLSTGGGVSTNSSKATSAPQSSRTPVSSSAPAATPTTSASRPAPTGSSAGSLTGACNNEGAWNCIGGNSFQRCASGQWSAVQTMAAGTSCQAGVSNNFTESRRRADSVAAAMMEPGCSRLWS